MDGWVSLPHSEQELHITGPISYLQPVPTAFYRVPNQAWAERPSIKFSRVDGQLGFPLAHALAKHFDDLEDPDGLVFDNAVGTKVTFRIQWNEYELFSKPRNVVTQRRSEVCSINRSKTAYEIAKVVKSFIDERANHPVGDDYWRVGPGYIELEHVYLMELRNVSVGSYQAILAVMREE